MALNIPIGAKIDQNKWNTEWNKFKTQVAQYNKVTIPIKINGQDFQKVVETYKTLKGEVAQVTTILNQNNQVVRNGASTLTRSSEATKDLNGQLQQQKESLKVVTTETKKYSDANGRLVTETKKFNSAGQQVGQTITKIVDDQTKLGKSTQDTANIFERFTKALGKMIVMRATNALINLFSRSVREAVEVVKQFDEAIVEFQKVSDLSGQALENYTQRLGDLGSEVARTRTEMVQASTEFVKSGFSEEQSAQLAKVSEMYRNIADEAMESGESASFIISQMKAFGNETTAFAQHTIDAVNNVSNNMAVSSSDISQALTKTSSAMASLGNTYEETIALVASGSEILTHQSSKVARG